MLLRILTILLLLSTSIATLAAEPIHIVVSGAENESISIRYRHLGAEQEQILTADGNYKVATIRGEYSRFLPLQIWATDSHFPLPIYDGLLSIPQTETTFYFSVDDRGNHFICLVGEVIH